MDARAHAFSMKLGIRVYVTNIALRVYIGHILEATYPSDRLHHDPKADECIIERTMNDRSINCFYSFHLHCINSLSRLASKRYLLTLEILSISFDILDKLSSSALPFEDQVETNKLSG